MSTSTAAEDFYPPIEGVEELGKYRPGGLLPVRINDTFDRGRYRVLHKLGYGASSTIWLARDQSANRSRLVSLKIHSADTSSAADAVEPAVSAHLEQFSKSTGHPGAGFCRMIRGRFMHKALSGDSHLCQVSELAGPDLGTLTSWGPSGSGPRRLRADVARTVAKQVALAVDCMHDAGIVHGDITPSNILFRIPPAQSWTDDEVRIVLGPCETWTEDTPLGPIEVTETIDVQRFSNLNIMQPDILLSDFGQSFVATRKPAGYRAATQIKFMAPEAYFDGDASFASDVWALGCVLFHIRAGFSPFDGWFDHPDATFEQMVRTLGRLPDPWWAAWDARRALFDEDGRPLAKPGAANVPAQTHSLRELAYQIGRQDEPSDDFHHSMLEEPGTPLNEKEISLLQDLLTKMLRYHPEERITLKEVVAHPWFDVER
ncbi:serine/threonine-protein kinase [Phanerochaete sordida]|uniref:Serine/threonine-protein kinase n=1 Tax=Phanerochaete sordida TaxID=48140 RepID=A0A9P3FW25_9APHY|nr:serine/threonine-protein kinase [Phanerochaete sordida]